MKFPEDDAGNPLLIDPSEEGAEPEDHLDYYVDILNDAEGLLGQIVPRDDNEKGRVTIKTIGLDSPDQRRKRKGALNAAWCEVANYRCATTDAQREQARTALRTLADTSSEYAGLVRCVAHKLEIALA